MGGLRPTSLRAATSSMPGLRSAASIRPTVTEQRIGVAACAAASSTTVRSNGAGAWASNRLGPYRLLVLS